MTYRMTFILYSWTDEDTITIIKMVMLERDVYEAILDITKHMCYHYSVVTFNKVLGTTLVDLY